MMPDSGFPRSWTRVQSTAKGDVVDKFLLVDIKLNCSIPDEVFEFNVPTDYVVVDHRPEKLLVTGLPNDLARSVHGANIRKWMFVVLNVIVIVILLAIVVTRHLSRAKKNV